MSFTVGGSTPQLTFADATVQNTAFTGLNQSATPYTTSLGYQALNSNTGANNTAVGYQALYSQTTGGYNTAFGMQAGYTLNTGGGNFNSLFGYQAGYGLTTGISNTLIGSSSTYPGYGAGYLITSGSYNTVLGGFSGNQGGLDIRTANNYIVLSDGQGNPAAYRSTNGTWYLQNLATSGLGGLNILYPNASPNTTGSSAFFACTDSTANRLIIWSNGNVINQNNSYGAISDAKLKHNITLSGSQWNDVKALGSLVKKYSLITDETNTQQIGWIAQDAQTVSPGLVYSTPDKDKEGNLTGESTLSINYSVAYMKAFKALSEALVRIEQLETQVTALQTKVGV